MSEPKDVPAGLLERAREDAAAARLIADAEVPDRIVGFHAQQAVEMFLKAVLAVRGVAYERTHDIERLTSLASDRGLEPPPDIDELAQLTRGLSNVVTPTRPKTRPSSATHNP